MKHLGIATIFTLMASSLVADDNASGNILTDDVVTIFEQAGLELETADQISVELPCEAVSFDVKIVGSQDVYYNRPLENAITLASYEQNTSVLLGYNDGGEMVQAMVVKDGLFLSVNQPESPDLFAVSDRLFNKKSVLSNQFELYGTGVEFMPPKNTEFSIFKNSSPNLCAF